MHVSDKANVCACMCVQYMCGYLYILYTVCAYVYEYVGVFVPMYTCMLHICVYRSVCIHVCICVYMLRL